MRINGHGDVFRRTRNHACRRIIVVAVPPVAELNLVGPLQVFSSVNRLAGKLVYAVEVITAGSDLEIPGEGGMVSFLARGFLANVQGEFDSVLLVCGTASRNAGEAPLFAWLKGTAPRVRRLGAVCVGAFLLAEAGLLDGRCATAHWKYGRELAKRYPRVCVKHHPLWVKDGNLYTSAGIAAGIDLALTWVEEDFGSGLAHEAARELVLFLRRPSGQGQLSVSLAAQAAESRSIQQLQVWMAENIQRKFSVRALADRVCMSSRNFQRVFTQEVGQTPSRYALQLRVEAARRQLETTDRGSKAIALSVGFGSVDLMRRAFVRVLGMTPARYCEALRSHAGRANRRLSGDPPRRPHGRGSRAGSADPP
jgi:transcriptional regulator GlxA family with amidase domain